MSGRRFCSFLIGLAILLPGLDTFASSDPTFLITNGSTLYRVTNNAVETFQLDQSITAMVTAPDGTVWAGQTRDTDSDGNAELYILDDPLGTPTLLPQGDFLNPRAVSLAFAGNQLYGLHSTRLYSIDIDQQITTPVGFNGVTGTNGGSLLYDPSTDTLYNAVNTASILYTVDYALINGINPTATAITPISVPNGYGGTEVFDGQFYFAGVTSNQMRLGTIDPQTGEYTQTRVVANVDRQIAVGLAVIPEHSAPADLDQDGDVDDTDYGLLFAAFTGPGSGPPGDPAADLDNDGDVDDADFALAFAAFTGPGESSNVPEPASLGLLAVGGVAVGLRRRR